MNTKYRAQILLEPYQHTALAKIASQENRSISDVVREILNLWLAEQDSETKLQRELKAMDVLTQMRLKIQENWGIYTGDLIGEGQGERDDEAQRVWRGEA